MKRLTVFLLLTVLAQVFVLGGMYVSASLPLWTGTEIRLKTVPLDPRSLFRGNYARLNYDISTIGSFHFKDLKKLRHGEVVYVTLEEREGVAQFSSVEVVEPDAGLFIRGRLQYPNTTLETQRVRYGVEAFFAPKEKALALEKTLRFNAIAVVMLSSTGKAALQSIKASSTKVN